MKVFSGNTNKEVPARQVSKNTLVFVISNSIVVRYRVRSTYLRFNVQLH